MPHSLPSTPLPLAQFTAFFKRATFQRDGTADVILTLPTDAVSAILDLNTNDGMALNVTVWGTVLDGDEDGAAGLRGLLELIEGLGGDED